MAAAPYEVPQSLWAVIELYAPTVELPEIKYIIGGDLIEQSNDLFEEIYILLDIWQSVAEDQPRPIKEQSVFPESPYLREQFIAQIQHFVSNLDATKNHLLQKFLSERKAILTYATNTNRPSTTTSSGRRTPSKPASGRKSASSTDLSEYRDNMSAFEIDKIVHNIQAAFRAEHRVLKEDVEFLHRSIDEQHDQRSSNTVVEPTLNELKSFANELENKVVALSQPIFRDISSKKPSSPVLKSLPRPPSVTSPPDLRKLPTLPSTPKQLSWRQRTLKKVSRDGSSREQPSSFLQELGESGTPESGAHRPKPPPPRTAFKATKLNQE